MSTYALSKIGENFQGFCHIWRLFTSLSRDVEKTRLAKLSLASLGITVDKKSTNKLAKKIGEQKFRVLVHQQINVTFCLLCLYCAVLHEQ